MNSALSLTHYRTEHETWLDTELFDSDFRRFDANAQYVWIRLLTGPEYGPAGFPKSQVGHVFRPDDIDAPTTIQEITDAGLVVDESDYLRVPNVTWGTPPQGSES